MQGGVSMKRSKLWFAVLPLAALILSGTVYVASAQVGTTFFACVSKLGGFYNVVLSPSLPQSCKQGDIAVDWNAMGPAGPAGAAGPAGSPGPAGAAGLAGSPGPAGATGAQGPAGAAGAQGATGPAGPAGLQGPAGPAGADGQNGLPGPAGPQGPQGPQGLQGSAGAAGATGAAGTARAWAQVGSTGTLGAQSNVTAVEGPAAFADLNTYCVHVVSTINVFNTAPIAMLKFGGPGFITTFNGGCSSVNGTGIQVNTFDAAGNAAPRAFFIAVP